MHDLLKDGCRSVKDDGIPMLSKLPHDEKAHGPRCPRWPPVGLMPGTPIWQRLIDTRGPVWSVHGREHLGPNLSRENALHEQVANRFVLLIAERTSVLVR